MKSRVGLAISIGLNLGLVGAFAWMWFHPLPGPDVGADPAIVINADGTADGTNRPIRLGYPSRPDFKFPTNVLSHITWRSIESTDYRRYVANLRAIHCPEATIEDIIVADINDLYAGKWRELLKSDADNFKYWQTGGGLPGFPSGELEKLAAQLDRERRNLIMELLDVSVRDSVMDFGGISPMELTLRFIPEERRGQVIAAQEQFARDQSALFSSAAEVDDLEARLRSLRDAYDQQLDVLLTPEERRRFEMTTSPLAMALRMELTGFEPTEEEFRQIYEARKQREEDIQVARVAVELMAVAEQQEQQQMEARHQEEAALQAELLDRLGPERYAEFQRTMDPGYQTLIRSSVMNFVTPITANRMYELQQIANVEAGQVRANADFTLEQRETALLGIQTETQRTIRESFGPDAFRSFQEWQQRSAPAQ